MLNKLKLSETNIVCFLPYVKYNLKHACMSVCVNALGNGNGGRRKGPKRNRETKGDKMLCIMFSGIWNLEN